VAERLVRQVAAGAVHGHVVLRVVVRVEEVDLVGRGGGDHAVAVLLDHRDGAAGEVAERVREVGVVALLEPLPAEVAVAVERHLAQQEVAERVDAEAVDGLGRAPASRRRSC
jgi:hypothetical protein